MRRVAVLVHDSVPPPGISQMSRNYFLKDDLDISLACPPGMLFLIILYQNKQIRTWHRCLKLAFYGMHIYVKSVKTIPSGKEMPR